MKSLKCFGKFTIEENAVKWDILNMFMAVAFTMRALYVSCVYINAKKEASARSFAGRNVKTHHRSLMKN